VVVKVGTKFQQTRAQAERLPYSHRSTGAAAHVAILRLFCDAHAYIKLYMCARLCIGVYVCVYVDLCMCCMLCACVCVCVCVIHSLALNKHTWELFFGHVLSYIKACGASNASDGSW